MDHPASAEQLSLKKDRSNAEQGTSSHALEGATGKQAAQPNGPANGVQDGVVLNGVPRGSGDAAVENGEHINGNAAMEHAPDPPPLDRSWREGPSNKSMATLLNRMTTQSFFDINAALERMADTPADPDVPQANGVLAANQLDTSQASLAKKRILMDCISEQKDRFTKLLVLVDWARNEEEMAELISIKVWQDGQRNGLASAAYAIGEIKRKMIDFKVPAPDIDGAMELLATGTASWVPDLGYIPPKRLTAKQLLKTLGDMNVALATRLNLHEALPAYMEDFSIADGRATFTVPSEFQVDLAIADEDPTTPWYFIDLRFLFTPSPDDLADGLRAHLEPRLNAVLANDGLKGCYNFLHNFVLTHKVTVLVDQAKQIVKYGKWVECVKYEHMRRSLVVQYWATLPGAKNWFEIGVASGKPRPGSRKSPTPKLSVRWFRKGNEVKDEALEFDWKHVDLQTCLVDVIRKHCFGKLAAVHAGLTALSAGSEVLTLEMSASDTVSGESTLTVGLPAMRTPLSLHVEPITGHIAISPPSTATMQCERMLNTDPHTDIPRAVGSVVCKVLQEQIRKQAEMLGWQEVRTSSATRAKLGTDVWQCSVFLIPGWGQQWAIAVNFGLGGERWWVAELSAPGQDERGQKLARDISNARLVKCREEDHVNPMKTDRKPYTRSELLRVERLATAEVSSAVLFKELDERQIQYSLHDQQDAPRSTDTHKANQPSTGSVPVFIQFAPVMRPKGEKDWLPWAEDPLKLTQLGIEGTENLTAGELGSVRYDIRLSLQSGKFKRLQQHLTKSAGTGIALNSTRGLSVQLRAPFGDAVLKHVQDRLRIIQRLDNSAAALLRSNFVCTHVSPARLEFRYSAESRLSAKLFYQKDGSLPLQRLQFEPAEYHPHLRIRVPLENDLNRKNPNAFNLFTYVLPLTLPCLETLDRLEAAHLSRRTFVVHIRGSTWYKISYKAPLPVCAFELRARAQKEGSKTAVRWYLREIKSGTQLGSARAAGLQEALTKFWRERGGRWFGIGDGVIGNNIGIGAALEKLDELVRGLESDQENATRALPQAQPDAANAPQTQPPSAAPAQPNGPGHSQQSQPPARPPSAGPQGQQVGPQQGKGQKQDVIELD